MNRVGTNGQLACSAEDYRAFRDFLSNASGIELGEGKEYLVISRLSGLIRQHKLDGIKGLLAELTSGRNAQLRAKVVDAMTTNETFWFRDVAHFRLLMTKVLPEVGNQRFRIWSAACSTGQEPYSISMQVQEYKTRNPGALAGGVEIVATDISLSVLEDARRGVYSGMSISRGLDADQKRRFFNPHPDGLEVRPEIKQRLRFQEFNLTRSFSVLGRFDVIFCRNVLIYFPPAVKHDIIHRMTQALRPGGYLFLGSTESMPSQSSNAFDMVAEQGGIVYRLKS